MERLMKAIENDRLSEVKEIVEQGIQGIEDTLSREDKDQLISLVKEGNFQKIKEFVDNLKPLNRALVRASELGRLDIVKYLIGAGADISNKFFEPLKAAAENGHLEVVKYFIEEKGVDIHVGTDHVLRYAAERGYLDIVKYAYSKGADLSAFYSYPLFWAARNKHFEIAEWLLDHGADPNGQETLFTDHPIKDLVKYGQYKLAAKAVAYGADPSVLSAEDQQKLDAYLPAGKMAKTRKL